MILRRRAARTHALVRAVLYLGFAVLLVVVVRQLAMVIAPVATGLLLAYLLDPLVGKLQRRGLPRAAAVALLFVASVIVVGAVVLFVPPLLAREVRHFAARWTAYEERLEATVLPWLRDALHLPAGTSLADTVVGAARRLGATLENATGDLAAAARSALETAGDVLRVLVAVLLTPVFAIYFLMDLPAIADGVGALVPPRHRERVMDVLGEINQALARWVRGQLTAMAILAACYAVGLAITGIPLGIGIGILTGLLAFVPYVGVGVGLVLAIAAALLDWHGPAPLVGVFITYGAVQTLDALVITPRVVGGGAGVSPVAVIFALTLGGEVAGYPGLLLAVPAAAVTKVLLVRAQRAWLASRFYRGEDGSVPGQSIGSDQSITESIQSHPTESAASPAPTATAPAPIRPTQGGPR